MIDKSFLDKWVGVLVPEEYGPNKDPEAGKKILGIYIKSAEEMESIKNIWYKDTPIEAKLFGQVVDIGELLALSGKEDNKLKGRYIIRLNASQSEQTGIFTLCHEVGHIHGMTHEQEAHDEEREEFADRWAFKRVRSVIDDVDFRTRIYIEAFSHDRV